MIPGRPYSITKRHGPPARIAKRKKKMTPYEIMRSRIGLHEIPGPETDTWIAKALASVTGAGRAG